MKSILILALLFFNSICFGRGLNPSTQDFGGIDVPDPNANINKNSPSRNDDDRAKANKYLAELGFGKNTDSNTKTNEPSTEGKK